MSQFKIATWNVNSLRVRLPHVEDWLKRNQPDVLALQETKLPDADFPIEAFHALGYEVVFSGQRTYNGVAIISRGKMTDVMTDIPLLQDPQRRVLWAMAGDICILNLYVPNGESVESEKYKYKLNWLHHLDLFLRAQLKKHQKIIILGDFNIAPSDLEVHDPKRWAGHVLCSAPERKAFQEMLVVGFEDCYRKLSPTEKGYSWWDYRLNAFQRNWGLRIDHILASSALAKSCTACFIDKGPRALERPSDHTPVVAVFE
ncbi:MAG: exodeoxyribonuclease III [Gammaproteobacteria bacterium RIFCSPHIGHO2_12_FULL_42_10]|nr:MAG: exodeoxyribonuclease III [Gammaproteobacteria bacterium RIFCSPHIGHO2_12_FULL_42_10]